MRKSNSLMTGLIGAFKQKTVNAGEQSVPHTTLPKKEIIEANKVNFPDTKKKPRVVKMQHGKKSK